MGITTFFFLSKVATGHTDDSNSTKILMTTSVKNAIVPIKFEGSFQWKKKGLTGSSILLYVQRHNWNRKKEVSAFFQGFHLKINKNP